MPDEKDPRIERHLRWFDEYVRRLDENSVVRGPTPGSALPCPCCRYLTLSARGAFDLCPVCFWEDDGQDDHDAHVVRGGPNGGLSLAEARANFAAFGACEERHRSSVRAPLPEETRDGG